MIALIMNTKVYRQQSESVYRAMSQNTLSRMSQNGKKVETASV
jgi:hypothetical protein